MAKTHKDLEFHVDTQSGTKVFKNFDEAAGLAVSIASSNGSDVNIDVLVYSKAGAKHYGGDDAVETYKEDPDASVFERIVIRAEGRGRIA